ncbi:MAG TPA: MFS transporter [Microbacteriaceae bacterium]
MNSRLAWRVLIFAAIAYLVSVTQRTSLGVAGIEASERFETTAVQLSYLAVFQLIVYASMQVPVGLLLDRYGSRLLITIGAILMAVGQLLVAVAPVLSLAVIGRGILGLGDAFTFISVLRLVHTWFDPKKSAILQQYVGNIGQLGQIASAIPFAYFLGIGGWTSAFLALASVSALIAALSWLLIQDRERTKTNVSWKEAVAELRETISQSGTRMSFWVHFTAQPTPVTFGLLWGVPFMVQAQGFEPWVASAALTFMVLWGIVAGGFIGPLSARHPKYRRRIVITQMLLIFITWTTVLLFPAPIPVWLLLILLIVITPGGPVSFLAFEYSAQLIPEKKRGAANGFINTGGFLAGLLIIFVVGLGLDLAVATGISESRFAIEGFRLAMIGQGLILLGGLIMFLRENAKTQLALKEE